MRKVAEDTEEIEKLGKQNKGFKFERTIHEINNREKHFSDLWIKENKKQSWLNFGQGTLQDLFFDYDKNGTEVAKVLINNRDRYIAATLIQWLGTNCGFGFLHEAMRKCGYEITIRKNKDVE